MNDLKLFQYDNGRLGVVVVAESLERAREIIRQKDQEGTIADEIGDIVLSDYPIRSGMCIWTGYND